MIDDAGSPAAAATPTRLEALGQAIAKAFPDGVRPIAGHTGELTYEVAADRLLEIATAFRDRADLKFEMCMDVCGVDYLEHGRAEWNTEDATSSGFSRGVARGGTRQPTGIDGRAAAEPAARRRFAVVYHLLSIAYNHRVRLKVFCADDTQPMVDSVTGIWAAADWFERETFDLFGILFRGHPDLRRLLTDYGFIGHPFRKDFPLSGNVEVRYDPEKGRVVYQPVTIEPRILVPKVIRHDNRYDPALTNAPAAAPPSKPSGTPPGKPNG
ncbi:MAG: NADH-quinone oxidoreductase subunit [Gammaproteobacteria bacterium]|nr:NADH-quinone oxidoreductase subunit [Gammaproteobacteria bacterium]